MTDLLTDEQLRDMANGYGAMDAYYRAVNELIALRARVAQLEAALRNVRKYAEDHDDEFVPFVVDAALAQPALETKK